MEIDVADGSGFLGGTFEEAREAVAGSRSKTTELLDPNSPAGQAKALIKGGALLNLREPLKAVFDEKRRVVRVGALEIEVPKHPSVIERHCDEAF